jgi:hypothetical protein
MDLTAKFVLLAASFRDEAGAKWRERLGEGFDQGLDLLVYILSHDLATFPEELDRQRLRDLMDTVLPGRLVGTESYRLDLPDLLEEFLLHVAIEEGLTTQWEWVSAIQEGRASFEAALLNPDRPRYGSAVRREPDRRKAAKIGRNEPCPCGSGRKYKHCCFKV